MHFLAGVISEEILTHRALQAVGRQSSISSCFRSSLNAALFELTFYLQLAGENPRGTAATLAVQKKIQGSCHGRAVLRVPPLARSQGSAAVRAQHGPEVPSRYLKNTAFC